MNVHPLRHRTSTGEHQHHVLDAVTAACAVPIEALVSMLTTTHHDSWEEALARYDHDHPAPLDSSAGRQEP